MHKFAVRFFICVAAYLSFSMFAYAQSTEAVLYKKVKGWTINQYERAEGGVFGPSCSAVMFKDYRDGMRIERYKQGYRYGINGLNRKQQSAHYQLRLWFDRDVNSQLSGTATFMRDVAYPDDDWLSHFYPTNDGPVREIANRDTITFAYQMLNSQTGTKQIEVDFDLVGSAAALLALDECYDKIVASMVVTYPESDCPDDGPRFAGSGVCQGRAANYLNIVEGDAPELTDGCEWTVNETAMPGGDYLFYLAASCGRLVSKLDFSAGAKFAEVSVAQSAMSDGAPRGKIITVGTIGADDPFKNILLYAREAMEDKVRAARCLVRPASEPFFDGELVFDFSVEEAAKDSGDGPRYPCGPFGYDDEVWTFWRVFDGYSWFFDFGQDAYQDIDPRSLTVVLAADLPQS